jgi:hypothetical protein
MLGAAAGQAAARKRRRARRRWRCRRCGSRRWQRLSRTRDSRGGPSVRPRWCEATLVAAACPPARPGAGCPPSSGPQPARPVGAVLSVCAAESAGQRSGGVARAAHAAAVSAAHATRAACGARLLRPEDGRLCWAVPLLRGGPASAAQPHVGVGPSGEGRALQPRPAAAAWALRALWWCRPAAAGSLNPPPPQPPCAGAGEGAARAGIIVPEHVVRSGDAPAGPRGGPGAVPSRAARVRVGSGEQVCSWRRAVPAHCPHAPTTAIRPWSRPVLARSGSKAAQLALEELQAGGAADLLVFKR